MNLALELGFLCAQGAIVNLGGGFSFVAVIDATAVREKGWLTGSELADMVSLGTLAPGMLAINATALLGYKVAGIAGLMAALIGMLLPTFLLGLTTVYLRDRLQGNQVFTRVRESLGPAALVVMALTAFALARTSIHSGEDLLLAGAAALLAGGFRLHPALVLLLAGLYGLFKEVL